ncbi:hypothetical protein ACMDM8_17965 [Comamonas resistens]
MNSGASYACPYFISNIFFIEVEGIQALQAHLVIAVTFHAQAEAFPHFFSTSLWTSLNSF